MTQDLSIFNLVLHASFIVQLVVALLLLMSLASWSVIFGKLFGLKRVRDRNEDFEREFWSGKNLNELHQSAATKADTAPMERIFAAIPAVLAYNRFARDIDRIAIQLETFIEEFSNILQRNVGAPVTAAQQQPVH